MKSQSKKSQVDQNASNPVGRPTDFKPEFSQKVVKLMRKGLSIEEVAFELYVSKQTIYNWKDQYPQFFDAITLGTDFSKGWWMKKGRKNIENKEFNTALYQVQMRNRFKWDKNEHDITIRQEETKDALEYIKSREQDV